MGLLPEVQLAACIYDAKRKKIVLYYVGDVGEKELAASLTAKLPRYMLPNKVIKLEEMPLTANKKTDRAALKKAYEGG